MPNVVVSTWQSVLSGLVRLRTAFQLRLQGLRRWLRTTPTQNWQHVLIILLLGSLVLGSIVNLVFFQISERWQAHKRNQEIRMQLERMSANTTLPGVT